MHTNIEVKARCEDPAPIRQYLIARDARFVGTDVQEDTYFNVPAGRLKLRIGNIERNLIYYNRPDTAGPKQSDFKLVKVEDADALKAMLADSLGVLKVVRKSREIWYIDNVKFHIDEVEGLGNFVEIEAGNVLADKTVAALREQCDFYVKAFELKENDMLEQSYSDMV